MTQEKTTLTLDQLNKSIKALNYISVKEGLDFGFNYKIAKACKAIEKNVITFQETLQKFFKDQGVYDKEKGTYTLDTKNQALVENFRKVEKELLESEHDVEVERIPLSEFASYDIPAEIVRNIFWLIDDAS